MDPLSLGVGAAAGLVVGATIAWLLSRARHGSDLGRATAEIAALQAKIDERTEAHRQQVQLLDDAEKKLREAFQALAGEALKSNNQSFLELAKTNFEKLHETAKGDLEKRQQAISELVKPVRESLEKFDTKIQDIEKARTTAYAGLTQQVRSLLESQNQLRKETGNLSKALRAPAGRGRWGEIQLRRVVELAGMVQHCDFVEQETIDTVDGRLRPDLIVKLPASKNVVVDAKAPLGAYLEAVDASDDATRQERLKHHATLIRSHLRALGQKSYWSQFQPAPEFVVMFLPGEAFFSAALEQDPALIEAGVEQQVLMATPTTLITLLRAVAYGWSQEALAENAQKISDLGRELYKRITDMSQHWSRVGRSLTTAVDSYNRAVGSLESRVLVSARRFQELQALSSGAEIPELEPVEKTTRSLEAPDAHGSPGGSKAPAAGE